MITFEKLGVVQAVIEAVEASKKTTLARFIYALGIRGVGEGAQNLTPFDFGRLMSADMDALIATPDVERECLEQAGIRWRAAPC